MIKRLTEEGNSDRKTQQYRFAIKMVYMMSYKYIDKKKMGKYQRKIKNII